MQVRHVIGIALLVAAVPIQVYVMKYNVPLQVYLTKINRNFKDFATEIARKLLNSLPGIIVDSAEYVNTANHYLQNVYDYFGLSAQFNDSQLTEEEDELMMSEELIRNFRPPHMEFRVGEVVLTQKMIIGVIVGWNIDMADLSKEPEYIILAENQNEFEKELQNHMIGLEDLEITHEMIDKYFDSYDGFKYTPKKWLQKLYPKD